MNTENTQVAYCESTISPPRSIVSPRLRPNTVFRLKLVAQGAFGCLIIFDSLYLLLCYVTFDFYGWLNNPFFGWLRQCGYVAWTLYFPLLLGALAGIGAGKQAKRSRQLAGIFLVAQIGLGFVLFFSTGIKSYFGWSLVYGPDVRMPMGNIASYIEGVSCLLPLLWISIIHVAAGISAARQRKIVPTLRLSSFFMAGLVSSFLYSVWANMRLAAASQHVSIAGMAFSLAAHLAIFAGLFVVLQGIRIVANYFPDPGIAQLTIRAIASCLLLTFFLRKIIFPLLAFNDHLADLYAVLLSLAVVLWITGLVLKTKESDALQGDATPIASTTRAWLKRAFISSLIVVLFYVFVTRLVALEWQHIMGSLVAVAIWVLLLWFFLSFKHQPLVHKGASLILLALVVVGDLAAVTFMLSHRDPTGNAVAAIDQYVDYDPSLFLIQQALTPVVHDDAYDAFYRFLSGHADIKSTVNAPDILLAQNLRATASKKPNIFLFVIDALRQDYVSAYNPAVGFTPAIEVFAQESVVFKNAYTPYAGTGLAEPAVWAGFHLLMNPTPLARVNNLQKILDAEGYDCYISYDTILAQLVPKSPTITVVNSGLTNWQQKEFGAVIHELEDDILKRKNSERPIFAFSQPANVHTLSLNLYEKQLEIRPHPGFNDKYASAVEQVDATFGEFISFLKAHQLYENSIIILTADHGESLGEMGREGHVANLTPEVIRIPLIIHLPQWQKPGVKWNAEAVASIQDITPTLYYLLGHRPVRKDDMLGHPLFTLIKEEQAGASPDHYFLMSSYVPVFGILSGDQKRLFIVDATLRKNFYYDLDNDPKALKNRITVPLRDYYETLIRKDLATLDKFYNHSRNADH